MNMKRRIFKTAIVIISICFFGIGAEHNMTSEEYEESWDYYKFFQFVEHHDDGAQERWTGCVTIGGSCLSDGPGVSADCMMPGSQIWTPCNAF